MARKPYLHKINASTSREAIIKSKAEQWELLDRQWKDETCRRLTERHGRDIAMKMMKVKTLDQFKTFIAALR